MGIIDDIKKLMTTPKAVVGTKRVLHQLKLSKLARVYVSANCPAAVRADLSKYAAMTNTELVETGLPNDELGTTCKKPFAISLLGQVR